MSLDILLIMALVAGLIAVSPHWDYSRRWGYAPSGLVSTVLVIVVVLVMLGKI